MVQHHVLFDKPKFHLILIFHTTPGVSTPSFLPLPATQLPGKRWTAPSQGGWSGRWTGALGQRLRKRKKKELSRKVKLSIYLFTLSSDRSDRKEKVADTSGRNEVSVASGWAQP